MTVIERVAGTAGCEAQLHGAPRHSVSMRCGRLAAQSSTVLCLAAALVGCAGSGPPGATARAASAPTGVRGAWRLVETAVRAPGQPWVTRATPQPGLYVFAERHYSYFYVAGAQPRARFAVPNRATDAEKLAAYESFIAGAGTYTFDGRTLALRAELRKNPNEMTGDVWPLSAESRGDTLRLVFVDPPFLPGREWRWTLVRVE